MIREARSEDLKQILELYLYLHETDVPENSEHLTTTWEKIISDENYRSAGYNSTDKTAFVQWLNH